MEEVFNERICSVCQLKDKCKKDIKYKRSGEIDIYYCSSYLKDTKKVIQSVFLYRSPISLYGTDIHIWPATHQTGLSSNSVSLRYTLRH